MDLVVDLDRKAAVTGFWFDVTVEYSISGRQGRVGDGRQPRGGDPETHSDRHLRVRQTSERDCRCYACDASEPPLPLACAVVRAALKSLGSYGVGCATLRALVRGGKCSQMQLALTALAP